MLPHDATPAADLLPPIILAVLRQRIEDGEAELFVLCMQAVLTASNAAIGGPGTAAAMASSRGWTAQVTPAMLVGTLGYVKLPSPFSLQGILDSEEIVWVCTGMRSAPRWAWQWALP